MTTGYWIVKGDKTSCGGTVKEGLAKRSLANNPVAVNGSKVSCDIHPGSYSVGGGHPGEIVHGQYVASTLYSRSTCPCRAFFIPSQTWASHGLYQGDPLPVVVPSSPTAAQPEQRAQSARNNAALPTTDEVKRPPEKREITLAIGVFFDGTGNNAINTDNMLQACSARHYHLNDAEAGAILGKCAREDFGISGAGATSYSGYYTNIYWLST
ncbi:PAAR domain-containing protein, partial [Erwinia amylovora]